MKVAIVGSRGVPAKYGGFESFAEALSIYLEEKGLDVTVVCEKTESEAHQFHGVKLIYSKYTKAKNPVRYYYNSLKKAMGANDIVLVCGVGGSVFYPLLRRKNVRIITHVDGREELRGKYTTLKKIYVRVASRFAAAFSDHLVCDSRAMEVFWNTRFNLKEGKSSTIEFGADINPKSDDRFLTEVGLVHDDYFLVVCRMVPENNVEMILKAFRKYQGKRKLVLVGDTRNSYGSELRAIATPETIFLEGIYDNRKLNALRKNCFAYVHGHSVGGTNPSLLEAMATGNICICHDNEFNRETTGNAMLYFNTADELCVLLENVERINADERDRWFRYAVTRINDYYNWNRIGAAYLSLFQSLSGE